MSLNLELFVNDRYNILKILFDNQFHIKNDSYAPLSQQEIADLAHFSKLKTNKIINELKDIGCIIQYQGKKGKYALTDAGINIIKTIQESKI